MVKDNIIFPIISNLNSSKSHGKDNLSVKMIKLCSKSIAYQLYLNHQVIFEASLLGRKFPDCWNGANIVPVLKKSKNLISNYRQISVLPIFEKKLE